MSNVIIAQRYAKAYFDIALAQNSVDALLEEFERFVAAWDASEELRGVLPAVDIHLSQRQAVLDAVAQLLELSTVTTHFLKLLVDKRRIAMLPYVHAAYRKLLAEHAGQVTAIVTTASPIHDSATIAAIADAVERLKNKKVQVETHVNPEVLGGVMVRVGDEVFDGTIAAELQRMREQLIQAEL